MSILLENKWNTCTKHLTEGLSGNKLAIVNMGYQQTHKFLKESAANGAIQAAQIAPITKVLLPLIRRVLPTVIANELIGVQPMTGPVTQINTLRYVYADKLNDNSSAQTSVNPGDEALSPFLIGQAYSSTPAGSTTTNSYGAAPTSVMEGNPGKRLSLQTLKQTVEAGSRRLSVNWTFEAQQDLNSQYGVDLEKDMITAVATEITTEIDQEILGKLSSLATTEYTYNQSTVSGTATFVGDEHAALAIMINAAANKIAQRTRRGTANWAVVSTETLTVLQSATTSAFARTTEGTFEGPTNTKMVGTLNSSMKVFCNTYSQTGTPLLIGYKGSETEAAAFFCPYIPLQSTGVIINPNDFTQTMGFVTRYGYAQLTNQTSSFGNSADYLAEIAIQYVTFS
jgi:hypothetical protein